MINWRIRSVGVLALGIVLVTGQVVGDEVTVFFKNGGQLTAEVGTKTNDKKLRLTRKTGSTRVTRSFSWHKIAKVVYRGKPLTVAALKQNAGKIARTPKPRQPFASDGRPGWVGGRSYAEMVSEAIGMIGDES